MPNLKQQEVNDTVAIHADSGLNSDHVEDDHIDGNASDAGIDGDDMIREVPDVSHNTVTTDEEPEDVMEDTPQPLITSRRPMRSTRNQNPDYVDASILDGGD